MSDFHDEIDRAINDLVETIKGYDGYSDDLPEDDFESFLDSALSNHSDASAEAVGREVARRLGKPYPW